MPKDHRPKESRVGDSGFRQSGSVLLTFLWLGVASCSTVSRDEPARRFSFVRPHMGTEFRIVLYGADEAAVHRAVESAFACIESLEDIFSDYDAASEMSTLWRATRDEAPITRSVSPDAWVVLTRSLSLARETQGAFDVTLGPLTRLWRRTIRQRELPSEERVESAIAASGWDNLSLHDEGMVTLHVRNMRLDFGAIAKGYALDRAADSLRAHGVQSALIDGGGDLLAIGRPPGSAGWRVQISPLAAPAYDCVVEVSDVAVATSGDRYQFVELGGVRYSHLVDPTTGLGLTQPMAATVIAPTGLEADALASTVCVLGPVKGPAWLKDRGGYAARWIFHDGTNWIDQRSETFPSERVVKVKGLQPDVSDQDNADPQFCP